MSLTNDDIKYIAHLARLEMDEAELPSFSKDLSSILDLVAQMNSVDTEAVKPMAHPLDLEKRLREDEVTAINERELFQSTAPKVAENLYLVPKVIE